MSLEVMHTALSDKHDERVMAGWEQNDSDAILCEALFPAVWSR